MVFVSPDRQRQKVGLDVVTIMVVVLTEKNPDVSISNRRYNTGQLEIPSVIQTK